VPKKLSKTTLALVFFTLTLTLSIVGMSAMFSIYRPSNAIFAHKLNYEPERYILLENPDTYTLEAINNGHSAEFGSSDNTNIDEIRNTNAEQFGFKQFYYKYNNSYYDIGLVAIDRFPPFGLPLLLLAGIVVSASAIVILTSLKTISYVRKKTAN
jgi:hypothetical protein